MVARMRSWDDANGKLFMEPPLLVNTSLLDPAKVALGQFWLP